MRISVPAKIRIAPSSFLLFCVFMFVDSVNMINDMSIYAYIVNRKVKSLLFFFYAA